jgi:cold shock CspA family protein
MEKTGIVKFWNEKKAYGFITCEDGKEYYTYKPYLLGEERLWEKHKVSFEVKEKEKKPDHAINVKSINNN